MNCLEVRNAPYSLWLKQNRETCLLLIDVAVVFNGKNQWELRGGEGMLGNDGKNIAKLYLGCQGVPCQDYKKYGSSLQFSARARQYCSTAYRGRRLGRCWVHPSNQSPHSGNHREDSECRLPARTHFGTDLPSDT